MKIINKVFSVLFVLMVSMGVLCNKVYANENIKVNIKTGIENSYRLNMWTPFDFTIENKFKDINGEIQIELLNRNNAINVYSKKISLPLNSTKNISLSGVILKNIDTVKVKILNKKEVVYEMDKPLKMDNLDSKMVIGLLSDKKDSLNYIKFINYMNVDENSFQTKYLKLEKNHLEKLSKELDVFNIMFLNNVDNLNLSKTAYNNLKNWVNEGGILIVDTGDNYNKNSNVINSLGINSKEHKELIKFDGKPLGFKINKGKGLICISSFNWAEESYKSWGYKNDVAYYLMNTLIRESNFNKTHGKEGKIINNYSIKGALDNLAETPMPKGNNILIILCIYLLIVSPVTYFILKRKDKREYTWAVVPIISIAFVMIIYLYGMGTRITDNIANVVNIVKIDKNGDANFQHYVNIFSPKRNNIKIQTSKDMKIYPMDVDNDINLNSVLQDKNKKIQLKFNEGANRSIEFYDTPVFSNNYLEAKNYVNNIGKIDSNITYKNGKFIGKIKNNTKMDLEDCWIVIKNNYINVGNLKKGQEKSIDNSGKVYKTINDYLDSEYFIPNRYERNLKNNKSKNEYKKITQKRDVISSFVSNNGENFEEATLLCWSNKEFSSDFIVNKKKVKKYEKTLVVAPISNSNLKNVVKGSGE